MFKLFVMSGDVSAAGGDDDGEVAERPAKRLLAHGPRYRMDGEEVRDLRCRRADC